MSGTCAPINRPKRTIDSRLHGAILGIAITIVLVAPIAAGTIFVKKKGTKKILAMAGQMGGTIKLILVPDWLDLANLELFEELY